MRKTMLTSISALAIAFALPAVAETTTKKDDTAAPAPAQMEVQKVEKATDGVTPMDDDLSASSNAEQPADSTAGEPATPMNPLAQLPKDQILGREVVTNDGEKAGDVDDLLLDSRNQVTHVVVGVGGFFGFGAKPVSLPVQKLALAEGNVLALDMTMQEVESLPQMDKATN